MEKQINFADIEYGNRRRKTKREEFLEKMESVIPWGKWVEIIEPYYPDGSLPRMPLVSAWQRLSYFCLFVVSFSHLPFAHYLPYQHERIGLLSEPTYIINFRPVFCYGIRTQDAINKFF